MSAVVTFTEERLLRLEEAELRRYVFRGGLYRWVRFGAFPETIVDSQTAGTLAELRERGLLAVGNDGVLALTNEGANRLDTWVVNR